VLQIFSIKKNANIVSDRFGVILNNGQTVEKRPYCPPVTGNDHLAFIDITALAVYVDFT